MLVENIKTGDRLEISRPADDKKGKTYVSQVENVMDGSRVMIHVPISYGQIIRLPVETVFSFLFFTEKGMLHYDAVIVEYVRKDGFNMMVIELKTEGKRVQRREHYRLDCLLPLRFEKIDPELMEYSRLAESGMNMSDGIIKDLAAGGIRFVTNTTLEDKDIIKCILLLENDYLIVLAKILHIQHFPKSNYKYQYRTEFIGLLAEEQEKIIQYIFHEQRKHIQKAKSTEKS